MKTCILTLLLACAGLYSLAQTITQAEYFIDTDKGIGKNTKLAVTLAADSSYTFNVNLTGVTPGYHKLYIRTKASNNKWSLSVRRNIEVFPSQGYPDIAKGEYFYDTDPGVGNGKVITISPADSAITKTLNASAAGLTPGYHKLYIRTQDSTGRWSLSTRRNVEIVKSLDTAKITAAEYFFSNDPGFGKATARAFVTPLANGTFTFNIPYNKIPAGADTLFIRVKDNTIKWSLTKLARFSGAPALLPANNKLLITDANKAASNRFSASINPNPVKGNMLTLYLVHTKQVVLQLSVYSLDGKVLLTQHFEAAGNMSRQLNLSNIPSGAYVLHLSDGAEVRTIQFIKE